MIAVDDTAATLPLDSPPPDQVPCLQLPLADAARIVTIMTGNMIIRRVWLGALVCLGTAAWGTTETIVQGGLSPDKRFEIVRWPQGADDGEPCDVIRERRTGKLFAEIPHGYEGETPKYSWSPNSRYLASHCRVQPNSRSTVLYHLSGESLKHFDVPEPELAASDETSTPAWLTSSHSKWDEAPVAWDAPATLRMWETASPGAQDKVQPNELNEYFVEYLVHIAEPTSGSVECKVSDVAYYLATPAGRAYREADKELNDIYQKILDWRKGQSRDLLVQAQRAWMKSRDAAALRVTTNSASRAWYESLLSSTVARTIELKQLAERESQLTALTPQPKGSAPDKNVERLASGGKAPNGRFEVVYLPMGPKDGRPTVAVREKNSGDVFAEIPMGYNDEIPHCFWSPDCRYLVCRGRWQPHGTTVRFYYLDGSSFNDVSLPVPDLPEPDEVVLPDWLRGGHTRSDAKPGPWESPSELKMRISLSPQDNSFRDYDVNDYSVDYIVRVRDQSNGQPKLELSDVNYELPTPARKAYDRADEELNGIYLKVLNSRKGRARDELIKAQRAWMIARDVAAAAVTTNTVSKAWNNSLRKSTEARTQELKKLLGGAK